MRKGFIDMWMMIGILMMLLVFGLLLAFQETGQNFIKPEIAAGIVLVGRR